MQCCGCEVVLESVIHLVPCPSLVVSHGPEIGSIIWVFVSKGLFCHSDFLIKIGSCNSEGCLISIKSRVSVIRFSLALILILSFPMQPQPQLVMTDGCDPGSEL